MSVFKKIRGTFYNAQQDIVEGLRSFASIDSQSRHQQLSSFAAREINLDAGACLLNRFQINWSLIQTETGHSAQKAEEVTMILSTMFKTYDKHAESVTHLQQETKAISGILGTMTELHILLDNLRQDFLIAEKELDMLENVCEEQDLKNRQLVEQKKLAVYKAKKEADAERLRGDLAHLHAKKVAVIDSVKKVNLQERAEAFMSAFHDDVNFYHTHGHPDRFPTEYPVVSRLSSIELDQDREALDSFLGQNGESDCSGNLELSGEGAYIEDDYITDYSMKQDLDFLGETEYSSAKVISDMDIEDEEYIYQENQGMGYVYEKDVHDPQNTDISGLSEDLSGHRGNDVIREENESMADSINVCDNPPKEDSFPETSGDIRSYGGVLDTVSETVVRKAESTQDVDFTVMKDSGSDEVAASESTD